jgi:hypothetical protein
MTTAPKRGVDMATCRPPVSPWRGTNGMAIAGQAHIDEADKLAAAMEEKWGADRLRLLVGVDLREKFDRQRYLLNQAIWYGDLEQVKREAGRMCSAWRVLDKAATEAGQSMLDPNVWEITLAGGEVAAIVPSLEHARVILQDGRKIRVFTLEEIARLIDGYPGLIEAKVMFPGCTVTNVRRNITDPLEGIPDSEPGLDDPIDDLWGSDARDGEFS